MTALLDSLAYADMAAIVVVAVTATAGTVLWLLDRCTLRVCACWALCLLLPLTACAAEDFDPDPCDPDCPPTQCGETGACNGE